jgi:pyruvate/2-oxoglutarate dehydrogenase complex dihydrolipoamide dehydrogenase (E3) component
VGRRPNTEDLSLEESGVNFTSQGIAVNSYLQTTNKNIFACGDVVGPYLFTHMAGYQAQICVRNAVLRRAFWRKVTYKDVAWALFTEPELAHLGLTEEAARKKYKRIRIYRTGFSECDRALTDGVGEGLAKVIIDGRGQIRGAHIVGVGAAEVIQGLLIAASLKIPLAKLSKAMFIYPTLSELIRTTATKVVLEKLSSGWMRWGLRLAKRI